MHRLTLGLVAVVACARSAPASGRDADGLGASVRALVVDSLQGGGAHPVTVLVAADSASAALLRLAGLPTVAAPGPAGLVCPGSTNADGRLAAAPVGYTVRVSLEAGGAAATRRLTVSKGCGFRYQGRLQGFAEGGVWELRQTGGRWRIAAALEHWIS